MTEQTTPAAPEAPQDVSMEQVDALLRADQESEGEPEAEQPEPEAAPEQPVQQEEPEQPRGDLRVPLREERERRRQAEQYAAQLAASQRAIGSYLEQMAKQVAPQQAGQEAPPAPDFETDPAGHLQHQLQTVRSALAQLQEAQQQQAQFRQQEEQAQRVVSSVNQAEASFAAQQKDYYEAVNFMRERQAAKFKALGMPEQMIPDAVSQEMRNFAVKALSAGLNPANSLFQLAKVEGYNPPIADAAAKLDRVAQGVASTRGARSSAPASNGEMTLEQAARMSYKDLGKMSEEEFARLMGG